MTTDEIVYLNLMHLIEKNGLNERICTGCCEISPNYLVNYRKGRTKHFKIRDLVKLAEFFDVSLDYLCQYKNTKDEFFRPKYKMKSRDEHVLLYAFKKLDPVGRINTGLSLFNDSYQLYKNVEEIKANKDSENAPAETPTEQTAQEVPVNEDVAA